MFAIGIGLWLAGLAGLTWLVRRHTTASALPTVALTLAPLASGLWLTNLTFRLTTTVHVVDSMVHGRTVPDWYIDIEAWSDRGLLNAAALVGGTAMVLYGMATVRSALVSSWTAWFAAACGAVLIVEFALTRDVVPALLYLAPLPLGVSALLRSHRPPVEPS